MWRLGRKLALLAVVVSFVAVSAYLVVSYVVADRFSLPTRFAVEGGPSLVHAPYEDITLRTGDGLALQGWYFRGTSDHAIVVVHGRGANRSEWKGRAERIADFLIADGYSVLTFDLRGHGNSQGTRFSLGYYERRDIAAAIDFMRARGFREEQIGLLSISLGGASALAYLTLDTRIGPMVVDSTYSDIPTVLSEVLPAEDGVPAFFTPGVLLVSRFAFGVDVNEIQPVKIVGAHPERPFLFIHCDSDDLVAVHHGRDLRAASANPASDLWIAHGCLHARASDDHPSEYRERVLSFLHAQFR